MRGGLDDALERLARRDKLRRRTAQQDGGTPPEVTELAEAVAAVVQRNPHLAITMGVQGAGDPVLLHFGYSDGVVRVDAEHPLNAPRQHRDDDEDADVEIDFDLEAEAEPAYIDVDPVPTSPGAARYDFDAEVLSGSSRFDGSSSYRPDSHRYPAPDVTTFDGAQPGPAEPYDTATDRPEPDPPAQPYASRPGPPYAGTPGPEPKPYVPAPAPAPPPVPNDPAGSPATGREAHAAPPPLPKPIPLRVQPEETEQAAKRLAAMLREDPSLLHPGPVD